MQDGEKRVFIVSHEKFPRGSAGANYIQYFAYALQDEGYSVIVIGENNTVPTGCENKYKEIEYATYKSNSKNIIKSTFDIKECKKIFEHYGVNSNDYFVFYNLEIDGMRHCVKKYGTKKLFAIRVEYMQPYQYKFNVFTPKFLTNRISIHYMWKHFRGDYAISSLLMNQDMKHKCKSMLLPIMADPFEYKWIPNKQKGEIINFIYPGMKLTGYEDDINTMFSSIANLSKENLSRIKLHITGASKEKIINAIPREFYEKIKDSIEIHGFMQYDQLIELYKNMDFLLLIRKVNKITQANFPSKIPELLSYGVIPICTDFGDYTKNYLNETCAILIPPYDCKGFVETIDKVLDMNQEEYINMRNSARETAEKLFYYKKWSNQIVDFISKNEG